MLWVVQENLAEDRCEPEGMHSIARPQAGCNGYRDLFRWGSERAVRVTTV